MQRSVFDVATDILKMSGVESMDALKLQQLVYYTFGWYAHVTGRRLFDQQFYAMQHGPVVSYLLTLPIHMDVSLNCVEQSQAVLEDTSVCSHRRFNLYSWDEHSNIGTYCARLFYTCMPYFRLLEKSCC